MSFPLPASRFPLILVVTGVPTWCAAADRCENIAGEPVVVSEVRYLLEADASNSCYANDYWDGVDELALAQGGVLGGAPSATTDLRFRSTYYFGDEAASSCVNTSFVLEIAGANGPLNDGSGCPKSLATVFSTVVVNSCAYPAPPASCGPGDECGGWTMGQLGPTGLSFKTHWRSTTSVIGSNAQGIQCFAQDQGCWTLRNESTCVLTDY